MHLRLKKLQKFSNLKCNRLGDYILEFKHIQTFLAIVELGSFSLAAEKLYLSQPTVSLHIKQLEDELGTQLIKRTNKNHELTRRGQELYKYGKSLADIMKNLEDNFAIFNNQKIRIGASSVAAGYILPRILKRFLAEYPETPLKIVQSDTLDVIQGISMGHFNLGIVGSTAIHNNLEFIKVCTDQLVLATPANNHYRKLKEQGATLKELLQAPYLHREDGSGTLKESTILLRQLGVEVDKLNSRIEVTHNATIKRLIQHGIGISVVSALSIQQEVDAGEILSFPLDSEDANRDFYLVYSKDDPLPQTVSELIRITQDNSPI